MSDSYKYDAYSCLNKVILGESATVHLLFAEYMRIKFHLDTVDVSFSVLLKSALKSALLTWLYSCIINYCEPQLNVNPEEQLTLYS